MTRFALHLVYTAALLAGSVISLTCAQEVAVERAPEPTFNGIINSGMNVTVQGDTAVYSVREEASPWLGKDQCDRNLYCAMQKNNIEAIVLKPTDLWIIGNASRQIEEQAMCSEPQNPAPEDNRTAFSVIVKPTFLHIPLPVPLPTATVQTGIEAIDKTPGIALVSSPIMEWLAETVAFVSYTRQTQADGTLPVTSMIQLNATLPQVQGQATVVENDVVEISQFVTAWAGIVPTPVPVVLENNLHSGGWAWFENGFDLLVIHRDLGKPDKSYTEPTGFFTLTFQSFSATPSSQGTPSSSSGEPTQSDRVLPTSVIPTPVPNATPPPQAPQPIGGPERIEPEGNDNLLPIIEPSQTQKKEMLTTITEEQDELLRKLTSTSTTPMPTPMPTGVENRMWEDGSIRLEIATDILTIKPSPSRQYGDSSETISSVSFSVKQVPTVTEISTSGNRETSSTISDSTSTDSPQASNLPASTNQGVEGVTTAVHAMSLGAKSDTQDESQQATNIAAPLKYSTAEKRRILGGELRFSCDLLPKLSNEQLEKLFPADYFNDPIKFEANLTIENKKARLRIAGRGFIADDGRNDSQLEESYAREFKCYVPESTIRRRVAREQARKELAEKLASGTNKYTTAQKRQMLMDRYLILEAERWDDEMIELLFPDHVLDDLNGFEKFVSIQEKEERLRLVNGDADVDSTLRYAERTGKAVEEAINVDYGYAFNTIRSIPLYSTYLKDSM